MRHNKRRFTLVEVMVVIVLIAISLGIVTIQVPRALKKERFEKGVTHLVAKLALAREVMTCCGIDVSVVFAKEKKGLTCQLETTHPLPDHIMRGINRYALLEGIEEVIAPNPLLYDATSHRTPEGEIILRGDGYERIIVLNDEKNQVQIPYPQEILSAL